MAMQVYAFAYAISGMPTTGLPSMVLRTIVFAALSITKIDTGLNLFLILRSII